jgi:hypothetical protein
MGNTPRGDSDAEAGAVVQLPQLTNAALNVPNTRDDHVLVLHTSGSTGKKKQVRPRAGAAYLRLHRQEKAGARRTRVGSRIVTLLLRTHLRNTCLGPALGSERCSRTGL